MDIKVIEEYLEKLCNTPSPTGFTKKCEKYLLEEFEKLGYEAYQTTKGNVVAKISQNKGNGLLLSAHIDTLGLMVRSIKSNGRLKVTTLGGFPLNYVEQENVTVHTRDGKEYSGTVRLNEPAVHGSKEPYEAKRDADNMEVVLDLLVKNKEDVKKYGINAGDFISLDPRFRIQNGFIKSRHLDDKASSAMLLALAREIKEKNIKLNRDIYMMFTVYEEVGHGAASGHPKDITDMLAVDMGVVYDDLETDETKLSICAKDSSGPYNYDLTNELIEIAKENNLDYAVDIYPFYGSDASAAMSSCYDYRHALIGAGIACSHGYERVHENGLKNAYTLLEKFIQK
ncbi:MAG: M42 family metallopeptidase [Tissierellia bacterium]|nr:M42 family metallopeptidase [Tissierellia bacterium]